MISRKSITDKTSQKRTKTDNTIVKNEQRQTIQLLKTNKDRQCNCQKQRQKDNEPQNTTQITKD